MDRFRKKIGYLIPEFPSQTHNFFWRELCEVEKNGVSVEIISTKKPSQTIFSEELANKIARKIKYLYPLKVEDYFGVAYTLISSGPFGWYRCIKSIIKSDGKGTGYYFRLIGLVIFGAQLSWFSRREMLNHIHVHSCADAANVALFANLLTGLPYSITLHGPLSDYGLNQKQKWKHAKFAIIITKRLFNEVTSELTGSIPKIIKIAPMGIDVDKFIRKSQYIPWNRDEPLKLFSCGRLNKIKGHDDLIRAVHILRNKNIDTRLHIAGEDDSDNGNVRKQLEGLIKKYNLENSVKLLGVQSENSVINEIESSHIFTLASWHEPLGVVIMEAMAMGLPVITTNGGGVPELIENGVSGALVDPKSPEQFADAILHIANNPLFAEQLASHANEVVRSRFHSGLSAKLIADLVKGSDD